MPHTPVAPIWPSTGSFDAPSLSDVPAALTASLVRESTKFDFYDDDGIFILHAIQTAEWTAGKLGYPILEVEIAPEQIIACFETAVTEYSAQINQFNIRENILALQGSVSTETVLTHREITPNLGRVIRMAKQYGTEAGSGGDTDWLRGSIDVKSGVQQYDLNDPSIFSSSIYDAFTYNENVYGGGNQINDIEVKRIYHFAPPAIIRYFDPFVGTVLGLHSFLDEFGFENYSPGVTFQLLPLYGDILRLEAIEFHDMIRKSAFSFELINNRLRLFPIPDFDTTLYFDYIIPAVRDNPLKTPSGSVSDFSNANYENMRYSGINDVGRQWIRRYTLAEAKELLGMIRSKYSTIPIPNAEVTLNGPDLISEARTEKENLITELRENLEQTSRRIQIEAAGEESDNMQNQLRKVPLLIYTD